MIDIEYEYDSCNFLALYNELFKDLYPKLMGYATLFIPESEAQDVVQEAFLELWKRRNDLEFGDQIPSYLFRLVYTKSLNIIKHKNVRRKHEELLDEINTYRTAFFETHNENIIAKLENDELNTQLKSAIEALPSQAQKVFVMSYLHNLKNKEIAEILDVSLRTVESHMYKALKFLRTRLRNLISIILLLLFLSLK